MEMKKVIINGLKPEEVELLLTFMESKLEDELYVRSIERSGNDCDMDWMKDGMNIGGEDMVHELFEMYAEDLWEDDSCTYELKIDDKMFVTYKTGCEFNDVYYIEENRFFIVNKFSKDSLQDDRANLWLDRKKSIMIDC